MAIPGVWGELDGEEGSGVLKHLISPSLPPSHPPTHSPSRPHQNPQEEKY